MDRHRKPLCEPGPDSQILARAVALVMDAPREEWGERWIVMQGCLKRLDARKASLKTYFNNAWRYRQLDILRAVNHTRAKRKPGKMVQLEDMDDLARARAPRCGLERDETMAHAKQLMSWMRDDALLPVMASARGTAMNAIAMSMGARPGTVRSIVRRGYQVARGEPMT